ncbi:MAG: hypothetical protein RLZZ15_3361 [Verrucomicrobiota bacterium]|jgi:uncharacterized protein YbaA (DUF1428 family)
MVLAATEAVPAAADVVCACGSDTRRDASSTTGLPLNSAPAALVIARVKTRLLAPLVLLNFSLLALALAPTLRAAEPAPKVTKLADRVRVELGGKLFTEYFFTGAQRPYFYPVLAADGTQLNRDYPMKTDTPGEETDHPHHRSLWFTHGAVGGVDFWADGAKNGKIVSDGVTATTKGDAAIVAARNRWLAPDGGVICTDDTTVTMRAIPDGRLLDYEVTVKAPADKPLVFGDTKEGSMAMRVAQWMTAPHKLKGNATAPTGTIINDAGVTNTPAWGKKSAWVDYHGVKDGKTYGVAMFDSPKNPRHPTWWHVRDYGLFAANPFGQHDFENLKSNPNAGDLTVPAGGSVTFRWRFYFHMGDEKTARVAERFADYAAGK